MAYGFLCKNCGHEQENHDVNLVNMPVLRKAQWFERRKKGYKMDMLHCVETRWTPAYKERVDKTCWDAGLYYGSGYVSPSLKKESELQDEERNNPYYPPCHVVVLYSPRTGKSFVAQME